MTKTNAWENALLLLFFENTNAANIGDATGLRGSTVAGSLYFSLHTSDPGEAGDQTTNETAYGSYARQAVARSSAGFTVTANAAATDANIDFASASSGTATITHFGIGTASSGAGVLLYKGAVSPTISVATGVIPRLNAGTVVTED